MRDKWLGRCKFLFWFFIAEHAFNHHHQIFDAHRPGIQHISESVSNWERLLEKSSEHQIVRSSRNTESHCHFLHFRRITFKIRALVKLRSIRPDPMGTGTENRENNTFPGSFRTVVIRPNDRIRAALAVFQPWTWDWANLWPGGSWETTCYKRKVISACLLLKLKRMNRLT